MTDVKENPEGTDNPNEEEIQLPSQKRKEGTRDLTFANFCFLETEKRFKPMKL